MASKITWVFDEERKKRSFVAEVEQNRKEKEEKREERNRLRECGGRCVFVYKT